MENVRKKRVEAAIRDEIGTMIVTGVVKDPRVDSLISITEVDVSKDTAYAKVFVSHIQEEVRLPGAVAALNHASGFIQSRLGKKLRTRNTPKLTFYPDTSIRNGIEMIKKIEDLSS